MSRPIFTSLSPNTELSDVIRAFSLLFTPGLWKEGDERGLLERTARDYFGVPYAFAFDSGRTCLSMLLRAAGIQEGDEVLLQAYTCVAVPNAVRWIGGVPVYVDCDERTLSLSLEDMARKKTSKSKALIVQHTFGIPAPMEEIMAVAKQHSLLVIEDCAHSLGAEYRGRKLGTFGDASFFSFGRDKVLSSVFGGIAITVDKRIGENLSAEYRMSPTPRKPWIVQQLLHPLICWAAIGTFRWLGFGKMILWFSKKTGLLSKPVYATERSGGKPPFVFKRMPNALAALALNQWAKLERYTKHRQARSLYYAEHLAGIGYSSSLPPEVFGGACLRYPLFVDRPDKLMAIARSRDIYLGDWYRDTIAPARVDYKAIGYTKGSCPTAETLAQKTVNLPTDIHVSDEDADRVIECVKKIV